MLRTLFVLLPVLVTIHGYAPTVIQIAGVFETESWGQELAFKHATDKVNRRQDILPGITLSAEVEQIPSGDSFRVQKTVCGLIRTGVAAIFGPMFPASINYVQAACNDLDIPHLQAVWRAQNYSEHYSLNVFPHHIPMSRAFTDLVDHFAWESFTILYEDNEGLLRLRHLFGNNLDGQKYKISMRKLTSSDGDFRPVLKELSKRLEKRILIDCRRDRVRKLLEQADSLSMLTYVYHYIFTTLDLGLIDFEDFRHEGANITGLRIIDPESKLVQTTIKEWQREELRSGISPLFGAKYPQTETAMIWDAVHVFANALQNLTQVQSVVPEELKCGSRNRWSTGTKLTNAMKATVIRGLTGRLQFDSQGYRTKYKMDVIEIQATGNVKKIGYWDSTTRLNISKAYLEKKESIYETLKNKTLKITTIQDKPFIFYAEYDKFGNKLEGNDRFSGYCIDLINMIKDRIETYNWGTLNFELHLVKDGQYGIPQDSSNPTITWNGMVGELMHNEADLALASLTISYIREKVIDFTKPFMNLGISILYRRPDKKDPELFSFLSPLSLYVWVYMVVAYLVVSFMLFTLARFTPYEWHNPYPCQPDSDIVENQFTVMNSLWFTIGSLMQQGSEVTPRAISTRIVSGIWWFFTLIMISSYTANLAAFLTVERMISPIQNAEDLSKQTDIKYGTVISGSTFTFFKTSKIETYSRMWNAMTNDQTNDKTVFVNSTEEGVARVMDKTQPYAYLLESTMNEYFTQRNCDLMQVGGLLDSKGYGIGTPRNSPYTELLSNAILKLQEEQQLQHLYNKWWKKSSGAGHCVHTETNKKDANELSVENVGGIFVVLICGIFVGVLVAIGEFVYKRRKDKAKDIEANLHTDGRISMHPGPQEQTLCSEMWEQFAFAIKCTGSSKKYVKRRRRRSSMDELEGAFSLPPPVQTSLLMGAGNGAPQPGRELYA